MFGSARWQKLRVTARKLRLPLVGLAVLFLGLLFGILDVYAHFKQDLRNQGLQALRVSAQNSAEQLRVLLEDELSTLQTMGVALAAYDDPASADARTVLHAFAEDERYLRLWTTDQKGHSVDSNGVSWDLSENPYIRQALAGESGFSAAYRSQSTGQVEFFVYAPIRRSPESPVEGSIQGAFSAEGFSELLQLNGVDGLGYITLVQPKDGLCLYYSASLGSRVAMGRSFWDYAEPQAYSTEDDLQGPVLEGNSDFFFYRSEFRGKVAAFHQPLGINDWFLFQDIPEKDLINSINPTLWSLVGLTTKALVCMGLLLFCLTRYHRQREAEVAAAEASQQLTNQSLEIALGHATIQLFLYDVYTRTLTAHRFLDSNGEPLALENGPATMVQQGAVAPEHASTFLSLFHQIKSGIPTVQADLLLRPVEANAYIWNRVVLTTVFDEYRSATHAIVTFEDISDERHREEELALKAHKDPLTDLYNREGLRSQVNTLRRDKDAPEKSAFLLLDLDHFKQVNDTLGHPTGDMLLRELSNLLRRALPAGSVCARIGGDEFAALVPGLDWLAAEQLAKDLCSRIPQLEQTLSLSLPVGASIGVHVFPSKAAHLDNLYETADVALYAAKRDRGGFVCTRDTAESA